MFTVGTGILFGFVWRSCGGVSSACIEASLCLVDMASWLLRSFGPIWFGTSTCKSGGEVGHVAIVLCSFCCGAMTNYSR